MKYNSGPKFTDDLRTILRQFSDLRQSYDNWRIHRTFDDNLKTYFKTKSHDNFLDVKTTGFKFTDRFIVLRFILRYVIRYRNLTTS